MLLIYVLQNKENIHIQKMKNAFFNNNIPV